MFKHKYTFLLFCIVVSLTSTAQNHIALFTDIGNTQSSEGLYLKSAIQGQYEFKKHILSSGIQSSIIGYNPRVISAIQASIAREFHIKSFPIKLEALYVWNNSGELIRENNWGLFLQFMGKRYTIKQGVHFRNLYYSQQAISDYSLQYNTDIIENWNILYAFEFFLKPQDHIWNVGICATNMDQFIIYQETNPIFCLKGNYQLKKNYVLFLESWYKSAGALNLSVNYFGFFVRTGLKWNINKSE